MTYQEHEISAIHEAGHVVYVEQFYSAQPGLFPLPLETLSPRTTKIEIWHDPEKAIYDGQIYYSNKELSDEQLLCSALSGRVAEIMARTEGSWDVSEMQLSILSGDYDHTHDLVKAKEFLDKLMQDNQSNKREQLLTETIFQLFSFLKTHWSLVMLVATDVLNAYDKETRKACITYDNLSPETIVQLNQLKKAS